MTSSIAPFLRRLTIGLIGLCLALAGLLFTLSLAVACAVVFVGVMVARALRGQRPIVPRWTDIMAWSMNKLGAQLVRSSPWGRRSAQSAAHQDVVDVGARVVPDGATNPTPLVDRVS